MKINQRAKILAALAAIPMGAAFAPTIRSNVVSDTVRRLCLLIKHVGFKKYNASHAPPPAFAPNKAYFYSAGKAFSFLDTFHSICCHVGEY